MQGINIAPFGSCPHAHLVHNRYIDRDVLVPCGKCVFCRMNKGHILASRLDLEASFHSHNLFFTLTFDNEHIPYAQRLDYLLKELIDSHDEQTADFLISLANADYRDIPHTELYAAFIDDMWYLLSNKGYFGSDFVPQIKNFELPYAFGITSKKIAQDFIARLRKQVYRDADKIVAGISPENRKFRYYICSEYGPNTYRPHYHGIIFCDSKEVSDAVRQYIYKAWPFCVQDRLDIQLVDGSASKYVASYVSSVTSLPRILANSPFAPFYLSSRKPALGVCEKEEARVFSKVVGQSVVDLKQSVDKNGGISVYERRVPMQIISRLFPKCSHFEALRKDRFQLVKRYFPYLSPVACRDFGHAQAKELNLDYFYQPSRYRSDGTLGWYDENNLLCVRRAARVCLKFGLTQDDYIDLLVKVHSMLSLYSAKVYYSSLESATAIACDEELDRILPHCDEEALDVVLRYYVPDKLPFDAINVKSEYMWDWINKYQHNEQSLHPIIYLDYDAAAMYLAGRLSMPNALSYPWKHLVEKHAIQFDIPLFDSVPQRFKDLFHFDQKFFMRFYEEDTDGDFVFNKIKFYEYYNAEKLKCMYDARTDVLSKYQGVLARKKINNSPMAKDFNKNELL